MPRQSISNIVLNGNIWVLHFEGNKEYRLRTVYDSVRNIGIYCMYKFIRDRGNHLRFFFLFFHAGTDDLGWRWFGAPIPIVQCATMRGWVSALCFLLETGNRLIIQKDENSLKGFWFNREKCNQIKIQKFQTSWLNGYPISLRLEETEWQYVIGAWFRRQWKS